ncbi:MAG: hypothetical protein O9302_03255 [Cyclobacteriaceae bacterium]|jgi:predicted RNase H-like HicB family nuclease|nr:hypothetical protein [Cytophagales bacterium]MCZ8327054.1 hypothetical protein [Cyclobacteriaceae bacterium]
MNNIKLNEGSKPSQIQLELVVFEEDGYQVAYSPALDLAGQGNTVEEAISALKETVEITLKYASANKTLHQMLLGLGWTLQEKPKHNYVPPKFLDIDLKKSLHVKKFSRQTIPVMA